MSLISMTSRNEFEIHLSNIWKRLGAITVNLKVKSVKQNYRKNGL